MTLALRALRTTLLKPVDLEIADGEAVSVRGPSGSGKTVLLRAIADLDPSGGEAAVDGATRSSMPGPRWRRLVRYAAAEPGWWADHVAAHFRHPSAAITAAEELGLPGECMRWEIARLSTGEKQRLAFLRALEDEPRVLLLDEPTAALDDASTRAVESVIRRRLARGASVLLITHGKAQAERLAMRHFEMNEGRLTACKR